MPSESKTKKDHSSPIIRVRIDQFLPTTQTGKTKESVPLSTLFVISGSPITPKLLNSLSPIPLVFAKVPPHRLSPKESVTIPVPLVRNRSPSTRESP